MKRKNKKKSWFKKTFGGRFNIWDIILLATIVPYFYLVFRGISYETGFLGIYYKILGPALSFAVVIKSIINFLIKKAKK